MKLIFCCLFLALTFDSSAQEEKDTATPIYDKYLNVIEGVQTMKDLEEKVKVKVIARMHTKKKQKIISYYESSTNEFIGFTADLEKVNILHVPYFRSLKGLKHYLEKDTDPREAVTRYYVNHPKPTIDIH